LLPRRIGPRAGCEARGRLFTARSREPRRAAVHSERGVTGSLLRSRLKPRLSIVGSNPNSLLPARAAVCHGGFAPRPRPLSVASRRAACRRQATRTTAAGLRSAPLIHSLTILTHQLPAASQAITCDISVRASDETTAVARRRMRTPGVWPSLRPPGSPSTPRCIRSH
jgi:hypothetical protein